jgi:hypothetical protein
MYIPRPVEDADTAWDHARIQNHSHRTTTTIADQGDPIFPFDGKIGPEDQGN